MPSKQLLKDIIYKRIYDMITLGELSMGEKISEACLMEKLKATRAPIRDAMKRLAAEKLILTKPKSGSFVFNVTLDELEQLLAFRLLLEQEALKIIISKKTSILVPQLNFLLDQMQRNVANDNPLEYLQLDNQFHSTIINMCENDYYIEAYQLISARMAAIRTTMGNNPEHIQRSLDQHIRIIQAIEEKDKDKIQQEILDHISPNHRSYWCLDNIKKRGM